MRITRKDLLSDTRFVWSMLGLLLFAVVYHFSAVQADGYYYLDGGSIMAEKGMLPERDFFSFNTLFTYWRVVEWLPNLFFYSIYSAFGERTLLILIPAIFSFVFFFFWLFKESSRPFPYFLYFIVVIILYHPLFVIRAELLMCLYYFIFFYFFIFKDFKNDKLFVLAFVIQVLWANSHPSFVLPIIFSLIAVIAGSVEYLREKDDYHLGSARRYSFLTGFLIVASLINPYFWNSFEDFFFRISSLAYKSVDITQPLGFDSMRDLSIWIYLAALVSLVLKNKKLMSLRLKLVLFTELIMTLLGTRYLILLMITSIPLFTDELAKLKIGAFKRPFLRSRTANGSLALLSLCASLFIMTRPLHYRNLYSHIDRAVSFLDKEIKGGNLYNPYEYGTYLIHRLYPKYKVFVDGRSYLYDPNLVFVDWRKIAYGDDRERDHLFRCYPVDYAIWESDSRLSRYFESRPGEWANAYKDIYFSVFKRKARNR